MNIKFGMSIKDRKIQPITVNDIIEIDVDIYTTKKTYFGKVYYIYKKDLWHFGLTHTPEGQGFKTFDLAFAAFKSYINQKALQRE